MIADIQIPNACSPCGPAPHQRGKVVVVTGLSGAGKSTALNAFEDLGYEAVDNLPLMFLATLVGEKNESLRKPLAVGIDIRTRDFDVKKLLSVMDALRLDTSLSTTLLFLDADDDVLARRYTETRRRHPIGGELPLTDGISLERRMISPLRDRADILLDTSRMTVGQLKPFLEAHFLAKTTPAMAITVQSFGFRNGLPREADLVFDVRFLRNPYYVPTLKNLTGQNPEVCAYIAADPDFEGFFTRLTTFLELLLPRYDTEGKSYLTIAIGCSGGQHRSVFIAERLTQWMEKQGRIVVLRHRDKPEEQNATT